MNQVQLIFLGSFLTFLATLVVEMVRQWVDFRRKKKTFTIFSRLELNTIAKGLDRLKTAYENKHYFDNLILNSIQTSLSSLEQARKDITYLNEEAQEKLIDLISDISLYVSDNRGLEAFFSDQNDKLTSFESQFSASGDPTAAPSHLVNRSIFESREKLEQYFQTKRMEKLVELVDIKRRLEDLNREFRS